MVTIKGLLIRVTPIIPDLQTAFFCCSNCDYSMTVDIDRGKINEPTKCPNDNCRASNSMRLIHNRCIYSDKQIWRLQETPGNFFYIYNSFIGIIIININIILEVLQITFNNNLSFN